MPSPLNYFVYYILMILGVGIGAPLFAIGVTIAVDKVAVRFRRRRYQRMWNPKGNSQWTKNPKESSGMESGFRRSTNS